MGLRKRGDIWVLRKKVDGRRHEISTGHTDIKLARKRANQIIGQLVGEQQGILKKTGVTFAQWAAVYDAEYISGKAVSTQERDRGILKTWLPLWGPRVLTGIQQADCLAALRRRRLAGFRGGPGALAEGTIQRERRLLRAMFEQAVTNGHLPKNPWKGIKGARDEVRERLLTREDEAKLRAAIATPTGNVGAQRQARPDKWLRFLTVMLETGIRLDECRNMVYHGGHITVLGKGSKYRDVPLTTAARQAIDDQLAAEGELWTSTSNRIWDVLNQACKRAGIGHISPHDLRHTFGHRYLQRGGRIHNLSKILGHASIVVTERHYASLLKDDIATEMLAVMEPVVVNLTYGH